MLKMHYGREFCEVIRIRQPKRDDKYSNVVGVWSDTPDFISSLINSDKFETMDPPSVLVVAPPIPVWLYAMILLQYSKGHQSIDCCTQDFVVSISRFGLNVNITNLLQFLRAASLRSCASAIHAVPRVLDAQPPCFNTDLFLSHICTG